MRAILRFILQTNWQYKLIAGIFSINLCNVALSGCSSFTDSRQLKIDNLLKAGKCAELVTYCDQELAKSPDAPALYAYRAIAERRLNKLDEAKADMKKALELNSKTGWYYREMGNIYLSCDDNKEALDSLLKARKLMEKDSSLYSILSGLALAHQRLGDYKEAIDEATQSLALMPDQKYTYATRAMAYLQSNQAKLALADAAKYIELDGQNASAHAYHGWASLLSGDAKTAQADCDKARSLDAKNWDGIDLQMSLYLLKGDYAGALAVVNDAIKDSPQTSIGYANKAHCLFIMKDFKQALPLAQKSLQLAPNSSRALSINYMLYAVLGDEAKALEVLKKQESLESSALTVKHKCRVLLFLKKYQEAVKVCTEALATDPGDAGLYRLRSEGYSRLGEKDLAAADLKDAYARGYSKNALLDLYLKAI